MEPLRAENKIRYEKPAAVDLLAGVSVGATAMTWQVVRSRHPTLTVKHANGLSYDFALGEDRMIEKLAFHCAEREAARLFLLRYLAGHRRWFGHWIPRDPQTMARV
jgi:hypothetical protein